MRCAHLFSSRRAVAAAGLAAALLVLLAVVAAQPPAGEFDELEGVAKAELQAINAPGATVAVVKGDRIVYECAPCRAATPTFPATPKARAIATG
jgi:hypothetical protein